MYMRAVSFLVLGIFCISVNDTIFKSLSQTYALHQLVFIRAVVGLMIIMPSILIWQDSAVLRTKKPGIHALRGFLIVLANIMFFAGLASLPLAEASAVVFISPVLVTIFSHYFLGERIGIWRWAAVILGLVGMICVVQPFGVRFEVAYLWPLGGALCYAGFTIVTRFLGKTDSVASLAVYSTISFLIASILMGFVFGAGSVANIQNPNLEFIFREWRWPDGSDFFLILAIGGLSAVIALSMAAAYRLGEASFLAPFEYVNLPLVLLWGFIVFDDFPNFLGVLGIALIMIGGLVMMFRERIRSQASHLRLDR
ncbi:MAG: EamA family transporter [Chloroflexi bacterium]|nr:EamA family transporter [Chloroflexota bacterium]|tara:strand:- start:1109 stop:2041 length:933 start_codon:yes stop_codon:yes gene_type:complete